MSHESEEGFPPAFVATQTRRAGKADGKCKFVGCDRDVPDYNGNKFYCSYLCGHLANPERRTPEEREQDLRAAASVPKHRVFSLPGCKVEPCKHCGGKGVVPKKEK